jgi:hypothetical protein
VQVLLDDVGIIGTLRIGLTGSGEESED